MLGEDFKAKWGPLKGGPSVDCAMGKMHVPFRRLRGEGLIHSSTLLRVLRGTHLNNEQGGKANLNWRDQPARGEECLQQTIQRNLVWLHGTLEGVLRRNVRTSCQASLLPIANCPMYISCCCKRRPKRQSQPRPRSFRAGLYSCTSMKQNGEGKASWFATVGGV